MCDRRRYFILVAGNITLVFESSQNNIMNKSEPDQTQSLYYSWRTNSNLMISTLNVIQKSKMHTVFDRRYVEFETLPHSGFHFITFSTKLF